MNGEGEGGRLELEVFNSGGCEMDGDHESAKWNCVEGRGSCGEFGYGVKSFRVGLMEAEDVGVGSCVVGQTSGAEMVRGRRGWVWAGGMVAVVAVGLM